MRQLNTQDWFNVFNNNNNVNSCYDSFLNTVLNIYNNCCPVRKVKFCNKNHSKPWITNVLVNACKKKNLLYKNFLKHRTVQSEVKYKKYKNKLVKILKTAEKLYYNDLLQENINCSKKTWSILNSIIKKRQYSSNTSDTYVYDNKEIRGSINIANGFNEFFTNIFVNLAKNIVPPSNACYNDYLTNYNEKSMFLSPVIDTEVIYIVRIFKNKNAKACHDMSMSLLKQIFSSVVKPIVHICNMSFTTGVFPDSMKTAKVIPLFKAGDKKSFSNYRPFSILTQFSKILEKLFNNRLEIFLGKYKILCDNQYGFRKNSSTSYALVKLIEDISNNIDNGKVTLGIFIDLQKAFDTLNHDLLIKKLNWYGLRGLSNLWVKSYLSDRKQYVNIENSQSKMLSIH